MKDPSTTCELDVLRQIYGTTRGYCHGCRRKLAFGGYARAAVRGAWDIDASAMRPACSACLMGPVRKASLQLAARPLAVAVAPAARTGGLRHTLLGGLLGAFVLGPWGALLGGLLGSEIDAGDGRSGR
ncbi:hypothetical protein [Nannocystis sp.]|uniref:hypothetical protein n=1 Tax=Nannocystis sp. TaxID=1962667 RepID=UPI002425FF8C|nr:hypothetical protein [Nannocystis sp.]MBK7829868.1 hypothetical protein [Nannocystis sp.]MBK9757763.1 hypothetical protein [Nannocystis sp.]